MTRKDYAALADILWLHRRTIDPASFAELTADLVRWLQGDNPRFDRGEFYRAIERKE